MLKSLLDKVRIFPILSFKKCPMCTEKWHSRNDFLSDSSLKLRGYTANLDHLELGIFLFDHDTCMTTLAIQASEFIDLYEGPVFETKLTGSEECPGYCLNTNDLRNCPAKCECAYVREILQIVRKWPKEKNSPTPMATDVAEVKSNQPLAPNCQFTNS